MPDRDATVVIVTKDRRDDVLQAVESALGQKPPVEVVVVDDGSQDGTADAVADAFPEVRVERREQPAGLVVRRNEAARLAAFDDPRVAAVLFQQTEEPDFAVRLLDAGYVVRLGWGEPVRHFASPKRDLDRGWFYEEIEAALPKERS